MTAAPERMYRFTTDEHWRAGARHNLELRGGKLVVPDPLCVSLFPGADIADACSLPATDACGRIAWLRSNRELVRVESSGLVEVGFLSGSVPAYQMVIGQTLTWLLTDVGIERFNSLNLQLLGVVERSAGWRMSAMASDGSDGLWVLELNPINAVRVRHIDCWGRTCRIPITLPITNNASLGPWPTLAASADGRKLVIIDPSRSERLYIIDSMQDPVAPVVVSLDSKHHEAPTLMAVGSDDRIRLLTQVEEAEAKKNLTPATTKDEPHGLLHFQVLALTHGEVERNDTLYPPRRLGTVTAMVMAGDDVLLATSAGLATIGRCHPSDNRTSNGQTGERRVSTYISPRLVSPRGVDTGWDRAEIEAALPYGAALTISWASTDDDWLIGEADVLLDGPQSGTTVENLDDLLPWSDGAEVRYTGTLLDADPAKVNVEQLPALLDGASGTSLWLKIVVKSPLSGPAPRLESMRVRYPRGSYVNELPSAYREHERSAGQLRRILAPFEVLYDQLDEQLASMAGRIDPATAPDAWTDFLLGWLGFPPMGDLESELRRRLLERASALLGERGTLAALDEVLDIVTDGRATVSDSSDQPAGWFLPADDHDGDRSKPVRLGRDTVVLAQRPAPSRPGTMVLGETPVGQGCSDPVKVLAERASLITVSIDVDDERREALQPIIDRLLDIFVPAHCRLSVIYSGIDGRFRTRQLDADFRLGPATDDEGLALDGRPPSLDSLLYSDAHWQLGATARLGEWRLPLPEYRPAILDQNTVFQDKTAPRLN